MKTEVTCPVCGTFCGWWEESFRRDADPPEYSGKNDFIGDDGVVYCSRRCMEEVEDE